MRALALLVLGSPLLGGCSFLAPNRAVALSTSPPGASVFVDGKNCGFVTPCLIQFDIDEDVRIDFEVPGFRRETRYLTPDDEVYSILWSEMYVGPQTWRFPLFLPMRDFLVPVKWTEGHAPGRIHVELDRLSDEGTPASPPAGSPADASQVPSLVPPSEVGPGATRAGETEKEKDAPKTAPIVEPGEPKPAPQR